MTDEQIAHVRVLGAALAALRLPGEMHVIVSFGALHPDWHCSEGSVSATVRRDKVEYTASAAGTDLATALMLARGGVERELAKKREKRRK